jgi:hypothetical protein
MGQQSGGDPYTWTQIADYLKVSVRKAQDWAKHHAPVRIAARKISRSIAVETKLSHD